jgi:cation transport regulator ChaC
MHPASAPQWVFGYGSLIYKVDFPWLERRPARIHGWSRRFWQGSHDHRGTPQRPGRVVTLVEEAGARCAGMAYRVEPGVFAHLDHREKNGYERHLTGLEFRDGPGRQGWIYLAAAGNPAWLGAAPEPAIARQILEARGPSGSNVEYLLRLADALRRLGAEDPHVFAIERELRALAAGDVSRRYRPPARRALPA